jgi:ferredoxin-NADP reductase
MLLTLPIRDVVAATPRARIVRLDLGGRHFAYEPGQAVMVGLPGHSKRTPYSIAGAPEDAVRDGCLELLVGIDGHSHELQRTLRPGVRLEVQGPIGQFTFRESHAERRFAFIAAGTGIAPLRSMLRHAVLDPHRHIVVLYSARTPDEFAYQDELRSLAQSGRIELRQSITRHSSSDGWTAGRGRIGREHVQQIVHDSAPVCFICGPSVFVNQTRRLLIEAGLPHERVRIEDWLMPRPVPLATLSQSGLAAVLQPR